MDQMNQHNDMQKCLQLNGATYTFEPYKPWKVFHHFLTLDEYSSHGNNIAIILKKDWLAFLIAIVTQERTHHAPTH